MWIVSNCGGKETFHIIPCYLFEYNNHMWLLGNHQKVRLPFCFCFMKVLE